MKVHIHSSHVLAHDPARVWERIRDFNGLPQWHPMIARSSIEAGKAADQVGAVRSFHTHDGGHIREQLLALDDREWRITYSILESDMGVTNYVAEMRLRPISSNGTTLMIWTAEFDCADDKAPELHGFIGDTVFVGGMRALDAVCARSKD